MDSKYLPVDDGVYWPVCIFELWIFHVCARNNGARVLNYSLGDLNCEVCLPYAR